ncbi:hypothetical protein EHO59_03130 [Leptospira semungkisensis]|uniref:Cys-rich protein n=1 Tax=Leptospira semungkisensis TaxID=2484985 RepID=A0A4R9G695_9LEPT|nr:hypothetical protein [Leptospira semungkisensis]TGK07116.1 hypothetical protein EHO59_03130 [Leptospira semungkisensis]
MISKFFFLLFSLTLGMFAISNCNLLVNHDDLCAKDLKNYDECFTLLLATDAGCGQGVGVCTPAYVQLAKTICDNRMKVQGCRASSKP